MELRNEKVLERLARFMLDDETTGQKVSQGGSASPLSALMYGTGMFSYCGGNELVSALITDDNLSTWMGAIPSVVDPDWIKTLSWVGPTGTSTSGGGTGTPSWDRDGECEDCQSVEWGKCELLTCFGEICKSGADLKLTQVGLMGCNKEPIYYIRGPHAGKRVDNDQVWQAALASFVLKQDFERLMIVGNHTANSMHFDGLQVLINSPLYDARNGCRCQAEEPIIEDWGSAAMSSNICNIISSMVRRIRYRGTFLGGIGQEDLVLVMTSLMRDALLDFASCGCGPCAGTQYNEVNISPLSARQERARLAMGSFGMGMFEVDGIPVPIVTNDWIPQTSTAPYFCSDIYMLTRRVGGMRVMYSEYQDFASTLSGVPMADLVLGAKVTDGGRFLTWSKYENECFNQTVLMKPRITLRAPWLTGRITNVCSPFDIPPITPNPDDADYFFAGDDPCRETLARSEYFYSGCQTLA